VPYGKTVHRTVLPTLLHLSEHIFVGSAHPRKPLKRLDLNFYPEQIVWLKLKQSCPTESFVYQLNYSFAYNLNFSLFMKKTDTALVSVLW
ncbi:MAG: hypothetical protein ACI4HK_01175, partial [Ruminococcus sp.]